jgi:tRNA-splicing endonuclease subunit Sen2
MQTSEEVTRQRRAERRQFKLERARVEREAIEQQRLLEESQTSSNQNLDDFSFQSGSPRTHAISPDPQNIDPLETSAQSLSTVLDDVTTNTKLKDPPNEVDAVLIDQEHLQLCLEEAFFLSYGLGALNVFKEKATLPVQYLFRLYSTYSNFPISENAESQLHNLYRYRQQHRADTLLVGGSSDSLDFSNISPITPDNSFIYKYVVYHHFRSLGWVVRTGVKFGVDFLLYNRGPAFSHAEFGVMIVPAYSHPYWSESPARQAECKAKEHRDWWWLHRVNRVQAQVHKTLMLVYVEIPPPWDYDPRNASFEIDVGEILKSYKVREFIFSRWTPNRHRG